MEQQKPDVQATDEDKLAELGYKQDLNRDWSMLHNFGVSFSIISVITGLTTLFQYGLNTGGPGVMSVGWIVVSFFTMFVALGMAEIVSAIPTSGGPYFWSAILAPKHVSALASWITGWFNLLGQVAVTTGITFGLAGLISTTATVGTSYEVTAGKTLGIFAALLVSQGVINSFGVHLLRYLNNTSILLHSVGISCFCIAVLAKAPTHQSAKFVFATFYDGTGVEAVGWSIRASPAYVAACGVLMSQYTITGFDASAHLSEETRNAQWSAPLGVIMSVGCSSVFGFFVILSLLFSIQDFERTVASDIEQPVLQILIDIFGEPGAIALMTLIMVCVYHCGLFSMTSNSRMMFGFARDGGLPQFFNNVDARFHAPIRTIWLAAFLSFLLAVPSLGSTVAFSAATSIATIGLYLSYGLPILIALIWPRNFNKGPFNLRFASRIVALVAVLWIGFITIIFCLPTANPVDSQTLNYTPVAVGVVALWAFGSWFLWARKWFTGPIRQIQAERLGVDLEEPGALERAEAEGELDVDIDIAKTNNHRATATLAGMAASRAGRVQAVSASQASNFPCPYAGCQNGFRSLGDLRKHKLTEHDYCKVCDADFEDWDSFHHHKIISERHITCAVCSMDFRSEAGRDRHFLQTHQTAHEIKCKGCGVTFERGAALLSHFERNQCRPQDKPGISADRFEKQRAGIAMVMQSGNKKSEEYGESGTLESLPAIPFGGSVAPSTVGGVPIERAEQPEFLVGKDFEKEGLDFPPLPSASNQRPASPSGSHASTNLLLPERNYPLNASNLAMLNKKNRHEGTTLKASAVGWPLPGMDEDDVTEGMSKMTMSGRLFPGAKPNPMPASFVAPSVQPSKSGYSEVNSTNSIELQRNAISGQWECPFFKCSFECETRQQLDWHFQDANNGHRGFDHVCPACLKRFKSPSALMGHLESATTRCTIRESKAYGNVMHLVSGGHVNIDGRHNDGSARLVSPEDAGKIPDIVW